MLPRRTRPGGRRLSPSLNSPALKKYGVLRPALVTNSPKRSTSRANAKREKFLPEVGHFVHDNACAASIARDSAARHARSRIRRVGGKLAAFSHTSTRHAHHHAQRQRHCAPPSARASRAGSRASSRGTSSACRRSSATHRRRSARARSAAQVARGVSIRRERKGYSGVALYAKAPPRIATGFGTPEFDAEGRYLQADFADLSVISVYLPSGSSGPHRQASKFRFLEAFLPHLATAASQAAREVVLCGDWNIAHQPIDLRNWRSNQKNSGFLPEERAWLTRVFDELGFVDVFRRVDPRPDQYTWWSNRGQAWAKNVGWRIDYQVATPGIAATARAASIYRNRRFSDHAPLIIDYDFELR